MQPAIKQLTLDELIAIASQEQTKHKERFGEEMSPFSLLCALSTHVLAHNLPAHAERFLAGDYDKIASTFAPSPKKSAIAVLVSVATNCWSSALRARPILKWKFSI